MYKPEDQAWMAEARLKLNSGTCTKDEQKSIVQRFVQIAREGRLTAVQQARKTRAAAQPAANVDALLGELGI